MTEVRYSSRMLKDLQYMEDYIANQRMNPDAAIKTIDGLLSSTDELAEIPERGKPLYLPDGTETGYRPVFVKQYLAVYRISGDEVQVARAVHTSQDYLRKLFPWLNNSSSNK